MSLDLKQLENFIDESMIGQRTLQMFKCPLFPSFYYSHSQYSTQLGIFNGYSFSECKSLAKKKSVSEISEKKAYLEWLERVILLKCYSGKIALRRDSAPKLGVIFSSVMHFNKWNIEIYTADILYHFAICILKLKDGSGVLFGSSCQVDKSDAINTAIHECSRKLIFYKQWQLNIQNTVFSEKAAFWLSKKGVESIDSFILGSSKNPELPSSPKINPDKKFCQTLDTGTRFVSYYNNPAIALPEGNEIDFPML
jgi:hypothetical protein